MGRRVLEEHVPKQERRPQYPCRKLEERRRRSLGGDPSARQDACVSSSPCDSGDDFAISIRIEAWTAVFRGC